MDKRSVKKSARKDAVWIRARPVLLRPLLMLFQCPCPIGANYNNSVKSVLSCALACANEKTVDVKDSQIQRSFFYASPRIKNQ